MAFGTASKIFVQTLIDIADGTVTGYDMDGTGFLVALFNDTIGTPDGNVAAAAAAYLGGVWLAGPEEEDGTEWDAGGEPLTGNDITKPATSVLMLDATDTPSGGTSATLTDVRGCLVYDGGAASPVVDQGISFHAFGGGNSVTNGSFTVLWNSLGLFRIDVS